MRKILVSAYACEPYKGSEQSVGWNIVLQLAQYNDVHVITRANNQGVIERFLTEWKQLHLTFHYYDTSKFCLSLKNKEKGVYVYYILWQIGVIHLIKKIVKEYHFDYSYHVTFGSVWLPSFLFIFYPRFIWGPLGGGEAIPDSFIKTLSYKGRLLQYFRKLLKITVYLNPILYLSACKADALLCRTQNTINIFPRRFRAKCYLLTDGAIESNILNYKCNYIERKKIKLIATSRLIHTKNVCTIIKAMQYIPDMYDFELTIVGSGPEENNIKKLVHTLNIQSKVTFLKFVPREEIFRLLSESDIYLFASLKEACNLSLLEAMAIGLPVICLNWSGMAISTDETCAIRLPVTNPEQMPKDMSQAVIKLLKDPILRKKMGEAGRKRVKEMFNWNSKGEFMEKLFNELEHEVK